MNKAAKKRMFSAIQDKDLTSLFAIIDENPDALEAVGDHNAYVRDKTPLMFAIQCANIILAHALLDRRAEASAIMPGGPGSSVLELCVEFAYRDEPRHDDWIRLAARLLDEGADPNSALWPALYGFGGIVDRADLIRLLLDRGANPDQLLGNCGDTVRELVEINRHLYTDEVLRLFHLNPGASVPKPDNADDAKLKPVQRPLVEHPSGDFETAVEAMAFAITSLRALPVWDKWVTFCAQGMGPRVDTYYFASIRMRQGEITLLEEANTLASTQKPLELDIKSVTNRLGVPKSCLSKTEAGYSVSKATPNQAARLMDVIFRQYMGIRPHTGEGDDYALGVEWEA